MANSTSILPTQSCFDDCLDFIENLLNSQPDASEKILMRYRVVHGIYQVTDLDNDFHTGGKPFAHGWVLDLKDKLAIQDGYLDGERITYGIGLDEFYKLFKLHEETRYSLLEVYKLNKKHNNYGPWEPKYLNLCQDKQANLSHNLGPSKRPRN